MDAGNLLKPMLARGELHCIGATTLDEYRQHIEKDAAFERRFQPVMVDQPTVEDTISILRGLKERYESHHKVAHPRLGPRRRRRAVQPLHRRSLFAGQGHRPRGRGGGEAAHRDGLASRPELDEISRQVMQLRDRGRLAAQGEGRGLQGPPRQAGEGTGRPQGAGRRRSRRGGRRRSRRPSGRSSCKSSSSAMKEEQQQAMQDGDYVKAAEAATRPTSPSLDRRSSSSAEADGSKGQLAHPRGGGRGGHRRRREPVDRHPRVAAARGRGAEAAAARGELHEPRHRPGRGGRRPSPRR